MSHRKPHNHGSLSSLALPICLQPSREDAKDSFSLNSSIFYQHFLHNILASRYPPVKHQMPEVVFLFQFLYIWMCMCVCVFIYTYIFQSMAYTCTMWRLIDLCLYIFWQGLPTVLRNIPGKKRKWYCKTETLQFSPAQIVCLKSILNAKHCKNRCSV